MSKKTAFMFSGQGAQYRGMGKELYENFSDFRQVFDQADDILGMGIKSICFDENDNLNQTEFTQPAILTMSFACLALIKNVRPDYVLGLSLGEYSALTASKAIDFSEALPLVRKRGRFMSEAVPAGQGAMSAIMGLGPEEVGEVCEKVEGYVVMANFNMPNHIVIAGETHAVAKAEELLREKAKVIRLNVSGPFHTEMLKPASVRLHEELTKINFKPMETPVITNLTARPIPSENEITDTLTQQIISPVKWEHSMRFAIENEVECFIELGPGKTLCNFARKIAKAMNKEIEILNIEDLNSYKKLEESL